MPNSYRHVKTNVSLINYHFVFCPRFRRKIFLIPGLENCFKQKVSEICEKVDVRILSIECDKDHVHLFLNCPTTISPADVVKKIKGGTGRYLMDQFSELSKVQNMWTRSYFVSTAGNVSSETIQKYVESQKKRSSKQ